MGGAPAGDENSNTDHSEEQIGNREKVLGFTLPSQVRKFFLLTAGIYVSTGVIIDLFGMFDLTLHGERYCVSGEFWKDAGDDQLLLYPDDETIWYYAHGDDDYILVVGIYCDLEVVTWQVYPLGAESGTNWSRTTSARLSAGTSNNRILFSHAAMWTTPGPRAARWRNWMQLREAISRQKTV